MGQQSGVLTPDMRIRVQMVMRPTGDVLVGNVFGLSRDSLTVFHDGSTATVPLEHVFSLEVSRGFGHAGKTGAIVGGAIGATVGSLVALALPGRNCNSELEVTPVIRYVETCSGLGVPTAIGALLIPGTLLGTAVGFLSGRGVAIEKWDSVWVEGMRARFDMGRFGPASIGLRVALP